MPLGSAVRNVQTLRRSECDAVQVSLLCVSSHITEKSQQYHDLGRIEESHYVMSVKRTTSLMRRVGDSHHPCLPEVSYRADKHRFFEGTSRCHVASTLGAFTLSTRTVLLSNSPHTRWNLLDSFIPDRTDDLYWKAGTFAKPMSSRTTGFFEQDQRSKVSPPPSSTRRLGAMNAKTARVSKSTCINALPYMIQ